MISAGHQVAGACSLHLGSRGILQPAARAPHEPHGHQHPALLQAPWRSLAPQCSECFCDPCQIGRFLAF